MQGTLPNDPKLLWKLAGSDNEQVFNTCSLPVLSMFELRGNVLVHHRLAEEMAKQHQMSELRAKAGRESGRVRRQVLKDKHLARLNTCSIPVEQNMNTPSEQNTNTPSTIASAIASAKKKAPSLSNEEFTKALSENMAYKHVDVARELAKMDAWLALPKNLNRKKTRQFVLSWLNNIEVPLGNGSKPNFQPQTTSDIREALKQEEIRKHNERLLSGKGEA